MKINKFFKAAALSLALALTIPSVLPAAVPASTVEAAAKKLNKKKLTLPKKGTYQLTVKTGKKVTWKSSNTKVATVSKKGKVTAKKAGTATITASFGKKKLTCKVTVANVRLNKTKATITKSSTNSAKNQLQLRVLGLSEAQQKEVTWSSSDTDVVTFKEDHDGAGAIVYSPDDGDEGKATITAKYRNVKMTCEVTVKIPGRTVNPKVYPNTPAVYENALEEELVKSKMYQDALEAVPDKDYEYKTYGVHLLDDVTITNAAVTFVNFEETKKTQTDSRLRSYDYIYHVTIEGKADPIAKDKLVEIQFEDGVGYCYTPDAAVNDVAFALNKKTKTTYFPGEAYNKDSLYKGYLMDDSLYAKCGADGSFKFDADVKFSGPQKELVISSARALDISDGMLTKWKEAYTTEKKAKDAAAKK